MLTGFVLFGAKTKVTIKKYLFLAKKKTQQLRYFFPERVRYELVVVKGFKSFGKKFVYFGTEFLPLWRYFNQIKR